MDGLEKWLEREPFRRRLEEGQLARFSDIVFAEKKKPESRSTIYDSRTEYGILVKILQLVDSLEFLS